jgi:hypothetical protein
MARLDRAIQEQAHQVSVARPRIARSRRAMTKKKTSQVSASRSNERNCRSDVSFTLIAISTGQPWVKPEYDDFFWRHCTLDRAIHHVAA